MVYLVVNSVTTTMGVGLGAGRGLLVAIVAGGKVATPVLSSVEAAGSVPCDWGKGLAMRTAVPASGVIVAVTSAAKTVFTNAGAASMGNANCSPKLPNNNKNTINAGAKRLCQRLNPHMGLVL